MSINVVNGDIIIDRFDYGTDINFNVTSTDGTPYNLSAYNIQFIVKINKDDDDSLALENMSLVSSSNTLTVPMNKKLTANENGIYFYAIRLIKDNVFVNTIIQGKIKILNNTFEHGVE